MGDITLVWFYVLAAVGLALGVAGVLLKRRILIILGSVLIAALVGAWVFGPWGILAGVAFALVQAKFTKSL